MASSKVDLDPTFERWVRALRAAAEQAALKLSAGLAAPWMLPLSGGWPEDLFDWDGLSEAFSRAELNEAFVSAIRDAEDPGVVGDLISATTMIEYLAVAERAFRARHTMRRPRAFAHALGRLQGHGHEKGTLTKTALEYVRGLVQQSKS